MHLITSRIKIENNKKKIIAGFLLALCCVLAYCLWFRGNMIMAVALAFFAACYIVIGWLRIETKTRVGAVALYLIWSVLFLFSSISTTTPIPVVLAGFRTVFVNAFCAAVVFACVYVIVANWRRAMVIGMLLVVGLITLNTFVFQFRAVEVSIMDFLSWKTALSVAGQYEIVVTKRITGLWLIFLLFAISGSALPALPTSVSSWKRRCAGVLLVIATVAMVNEGAKSYIIRNWRDDGTVINGYLLNFFIGIREMHVQEPEHYSVEKLATIEENYSDNDNGANDGSYPNIIVIMDEGFADFTCFENQPEVNQTITPFIDAMSENVIKGYALSSVFGGNTANSEFEFLTGHNMMFLPPNTVPYQQFIRDDISALPWLLREYGYTCHSTHPYGETGWCRNIVYPYLGFENSYFLDDYPQEKKLRYYVSDEEVFDEALKAIDGQENPLFLFAITMQNHGDFYYTGEDFEKKIVLQQGQEYPAAEQYLNLIHETDRAVEKLLTALESSEEDTVVLFFGDHYPKVENGFYELLHGGSFDGINQQQRQYKIPFFIWANYEIPTGSVECTSISYLSRYLLECAGIPLPAYYQFLQDAEQVIPAYNSRGYFSNQANEFVSLANASGEEKEMLEALQVVQYNNLFDAKNRSERFFPSVASK